MSKNAFTLNQVVFNEKQKVGINLSLMSIRKEDILRSLGD